MTWRRLGVLLRHLPDDAATRREVFGPPSEWGLGEHLLAVIADALHAANWQRAGNKKVPRPKQIPRPGVDTGPRRTALNATQVEARLRRLHARDKQRRKSEVTRGR